MSLGALYFDDDVEALWVFHEVSPGPTRYQKCTAKAGVPRVPRFGQLPACGFPKWGMPGLDSFRAISCKAALALTGQQDCQPDAL